MWRSPDSRAAGLPPPRTSPIPATFAVSSPYFSLCASHRPATTSSAQEHSAADLLIFLKRHQLSDAEGPFIASGYLLGGAD